MYIVYIPFRSPPKTRTFPTQTRVIWVPCGYIENQVQVLQPLYSFALPQKFQIPVTPQLETTRTTTTQKNRTRTTPDLKRGTPVFRPHLTKTVGQETCQRSLLIWPFEQQMDWSSQESPPSHRYHYSWYSACCKGDIRGGVKKWVFGKSFVKKWRIFEQRSVLEVKHVQNIL